MTRQTWSPQPKHKENVSYSIACLALPVLPHCDVFLNNRTSLNWALKLINSVSQRGTILPGGNKRHVHLMVTDRGFGNRKWAQVKHKVYTSWIMAKTLIFHKCKTCQPLHLKPPQAFFVKKWNNLMAQLGSQTNVSTRK